MSGIEVIIRTAVVWEIVPDRKEDYGFGREVTIVGHVAVKDDHDQIHYLTNGSRNCVHEAKLGERGVIRFKPGFFSEAEFFRKG